jgi:asparagine synthase (glutamine-hydrolysing)
MPGLILSNRTLSLPGQGILPHMCFEKIETAGWDDELQISISTYKNYPFRTFAAGDLVVLFEGYIYDLPANLIEEKIGEILKNDDFTDSLAQWISERDGEFILVVLDSKSRLILLFNDLFGRLPLYYHSEREQFVISREISVLLDTIKPDADPVSVASNLLLGFAIGNRTVHRGVLTLPGHSMIEWDVEQKTLHVKTFSDPANLFKGKDSILFPVQLKEELSSALKRRINVCGPSGLALSGGLDSRILAGILEEAGMKLPTFTYTRSKDGNEADVRSARQVAERFKLGTLHEIVDLSEVNEENREDLQRIKRGQNFLAMAYILPFLDLFRQRVLCQITGDGGDKTLESIFPLRKLKSKEELLNYVLKKHAQLPLEKVAEQAGIAILIIKDHLLTVLNANEELTFDERYALFILKERGMNWLFEGEDRNRYYSWSTTPYYSPAFVKLSLAVPVIEKQYGRLFTSILHLLPGNTDDILNPNWGLAPNDTSAIKKLFQRQKWKTMMPSFILRMIGK